MVGLIFGILFILFGIFLIVGALINSSGAAMIIQVIIAVLFIGAGIELIVKFANRRKFGTDVLAQFEGVHLGGLPLGEVSCQVVALSDRMIFFSGNSRFELEYYKVVAADFREKSELVSASAGSVVAGAVLFGALGAVIASRPKNKREYIMVITYISNGGNNSVAIAVPYQSSAEADKALNIIRRNITTTQNIVL